MLSFVGILFVECCAALLSGRNVVGVYRRIQALFWIQKRRHDDLTDMEMYYVILFVLLMAQGKQCISLEDIGRSIRMNYDDFSQLVQKCTKEELLLHKDNSYNIRPVMAHFNELRSIYIHGKSQNSEVVKGVYKMLEMAYYLTACNPAMTFVSLKGNDEFRERILK